MNTTTTGTDRINAAACRVYDAECALHAAHQAHMDAWVAAANEKLHVAIEEYLAAMALAA